ncbi:NADH-quinone oxidoreductase subunit C [Candidatus Sumerlaeota bacterium]|nr:NADH-quinone oxidoreductase subunit C [Candidatus Sumerlaeota bacterium]
MTFEEIYTLLKGRFGDKILEKNDENIDPYIIISPDAIVQIMRFLKHEKELAFDFLSCISGVDYPDEGIIETVYHIFSYLKGHKLVIKVRLSRDNPIVDSVTGVWRSADWLEREVYDLLGVKFKGHPNLRRILLPEDWEGHPLRKDYQEPAEYHGIPNK